MDLTERQQAVFDFLKDYRSRFRRSPSYEEIRRHFGFGSLNSVRKHLQQLERKGYIRTPWANQKRALELVAEKVDPPPAAQELPLAGSIGGSGLLESRGPSQTVEVPASLLRPGDHYALSVRGEALVAEGLFDGDLLVVRRCDRAEPGQVVVAAIEGKATVKRLEPQGDRVKLELPGPSLAPSVPEGRKRWVPSRVRILGVCVALIRRYA